ncbi:Uu.00g055350.m01.CDS01 [Anthostomella pinea]|uniref:Uu.00g055350.m01.CDS01 n=1 Tax=Anthostomella pinea TaxID=933095 RepID=A0AAI8VXF5_9PEZI|nr:Uu.00g055350.m01.CDS01 [Anthostomella pinea]
MSRDDHFEYLAGLARDLPEHWVCEVCVKLHPVAKSDVFKTSCQLQSCPRSSTWDEEAYTNLPRHVRVDHRHIRLDHRHVALALKYTRLQRRKYQNYLRILMTPYHNPRYITHMGSRASERPAIDAHYSTHPKVVLGIDGNLMFLLLSIWRYTSALEPVSPQAIGCLLIRPHLVSDIQPISSNAANPYARLGAVQHLGFPLPRHTRPTLEDLNGLHNAIKKAFYTRHAVTFRYVHLPEAPRCASGRTWGTKVLPWIHVAERTDDPTERMLARNYFEFGPTVRHDPGTVRRISMIHSHMKPAG